MTRNFKKATQKIVLPLSLHSTVANLMLFLSWKPIRRVLLQSLRATTAAPFCKNAFRASPSAALRAPAQGNDENALLDLPLWHPGALSVDSTPWRDGRRRARGASVLSGLMRSVAQRHWRWRYRRCA